MSRSGGHGSATRVPETVAPAISRARRKPSKRKRPSRAERSESIRNAIFEAAERVVGRYGYAGASVARITSQAKLAQGTFYNYFDSRQDLLDQLLPRTGSVMLEYMRNHVSREARGAERELQRFRAFFNFLLEKPHFYRILNEAEMFAPVGFNQHLENVAKHYQSSFARALARGELPGYELKDIEVIVAILMAARNYLGLRYARSNGKVRPLPERVTSAYRKLIEFGVFGGGRSNGKRADG
jgi:AcrR family transcriptional regulator